MAIADRATVLGLYDEGVDAFVATTDTLEPADWGRVACGDWTATELTRHVLAVAGWYHAWMDRAERGDAAPPFGVSELAAHNDRSLRKAPDLDGRDAATQFGERARAYRERLPGCWDLRYGYPRGSVTAGLHAAVAACEWHLHAWDLATMVGRAHRPSDPGALYAATSECLAVAEGGLKGRVASLLVPLGERLRPWEAVLRRSGRAPGPED